MLDKVQQNIVKNILATSIGMGLSLNTSLPSYADTSPDNPMLSETSCIDVVDQALKKVREGVEISDQEKNLVLQCSAKLSRPNLNDPNAPLPKVSECISYAQTVFQEGIKKLQSIDWTKDPYRSLTRCREVVRTIYIPSESMLPTLKVNDRVIVDKVAYRTQLPKRGDLILFNPTQVLQDQKFDKPFIKRVIGLPGETIAVKGGKVYVNQKPLQENYLQESPAYELESVTVPANEYFVLGDNRNNSYDSHYWGSVPRDLIIGQVVWRIYPIDRAGSL